MNTKEEITIISEDVKKSYSEKSVIWDTHDRWHSYTHYMIESLISRTQKRKDIPLSAHILNLGSGGNDHCFNQENMLHVDIVEKNIKNKKHHLVSDVQYLNIDNYYDVIICVGSVINYCDPLKVIKNISNHAKQGTILLLEFESSSSLEYILSNSFKKDVSCVKTFYNGNEEKIWVYSEKYIKKMLNRYNFRIEQTEYFHILSPLVYTISKSEKIASYTSLSDYIFKYIPFIRRFSSNIFISAIFQK